MPSHDPKPNPGATITRRAALAAPLILPVAATAAPQARTGADPVFAAYGDWRRKLAIYDEALETANAHPVRSMTYANAVQRVSDNECETEWSAKLALARTIATTPAGVIRQLHFAQEGHIWTFGDWSDDLDESLYESIIAGVARLAV